MENSLTIQFQAALSQISHFEPPKNREEVGKQLGYLAEAIGICEKVLVYLATSEQGREEMLDYLFQYKQLINTERLLQDKKLEFPVQPAAEPVKKRWWQR